MNYYVYLKYMGKKGKKEKKEENKKETQLEIRKIERKISREKKKEGFQCSHCHAWVSLKAAGTKHRNHCPECLWSKHVGRLEQLREICSGAMIPIGLTFKKEGIDKYTGKPRQGELMIIHQCTKCGKISINRLAGDDNPDAVMKIFKYSLNMPKELCERLKKENVDILTEKNREEIEKQLGFKDFIKLGKLE